MLESEDEAKGRHTTYIVGFNILEPKGRVVMLPGAITLIFIYFIPELKCIGRIYIVHILMVIALERKKEESKHARKLN